MKIAVTGGRDFNDEPFVISVIDDLIESGASFIGIGCARGLDKIVRQYCELIGFPRKVFYADWKQFGLAAGSIRNGEILDEVKPQFLVAFPGGPGTENMKKQAKMRGIRILEKDPTQIFLNI